MRGQKKLPDKCYEQLKDKEEKIAKGELMDLVQDITSKAQAAGGDSYVEDASMILVHIPSFLKDQKQSAVSSVLEPQSAESDEHHQISDGNTI